MPTPIVNNYVVGRGEVHIAPFMPGTQTPLEYRYIGNNPAFSLNITTTELDHFSSDHGIKELDLSIPTQVTRAGSFSTDNIDRDNLALLFLGRKLVNTTTAATAISQTFNAVNKGRSYQLGITSAAPYGVRNVTNVVVKVGAVVKVAGVDYTIDLARGFITLLIGGSIVSGVDALTVTYDQVSGNTDSVISGNTPFEGAVKFLADNLVGNNDDYDLPWVRITPNGDFGLKADNAVQAITFNMKVLKLPNGAAYYVNGQPRA